MNKQTILLVEDNFLNRRLTKKVLLAQDYLIEEAKDFNEALKILNSKIIDLVIIDINLGDNEKDGISLSMEIRESYSIPFIFLTAYESGDIIKKALQSSPHSYLTKPFKPADLSAAVEIALNTTVKQPENNSSFLIVKDSDHNTKLPFTQINYIASEGNYIIISSNYKTFKIRSTLKQIMETLPNDIFVQTHRAFVINKYKINKYSNREVIINDEHIPISKSYIHNLKMAY